MKTRSPCFGTPTEPAAGLGSLDINRQRRPGVGIPGEGFEQRPKPTPQSNSHSPAEQTRRTRVSSCDGPTHNDGSADDKRAPALQRRARAGRGRLPNGFAMCLLAIGTNAGVPNAAAVASPSRGCDLALLWNGGWRKYRIDSSPRVLPSSLPPLQANQRTAFYNQPLRFRSDSLNESIGPKPGSVAKWPSAYLNGREIRTIRPYPESLKDRNGFDSQPDIGG